MTSIFSIASVTPTTTGGHGGGDHSTLTNRMLRDENKHLKDELTESRRKIQTLAKKLSAASADVAKSVHSVANYDTLEASFRDCSKERDQLHHDLAHNLKDKEDLKTMIANLQEQVSAMERSHEAQMETSKEKNEALKNLLDTVSSQAVEMASRKAAVEANFMAAQQNVQALQEENTEANQKQKLLLQDLKIVTAEKVELNKHVSELTSTIRANEQQRQQMESKINALTQETQKGQREFHNLSVQHEQLLAAKNTLAATLTARDQTIQEQCGTIQQVESDKVRKQVELERLGNKLGMVSHSHDIALMEIEDLKERLDQTRQTLKTTEKESQQNASYLESLLGNAAQQKKDLQGDLESTMAKLTAAQEEVAKLKEQLADRDAEIKAEKGKLVDVGCSEKIQVLNGVGKISFSDSHF